MECRSTRKERLQRAHLEGRELLLECLYLLVVRLRLRRLRLHAAHLGQVHVSCRRRLHRVDQPRLQLRDRSPRRPPRPQRVSPPPAQRGRSEPSEVSGAALRQRVAPHGWGSPAGRVDTTACPVLPLEGAGCMHPNRVRPYVPETPFAVRMGSTNDPQARPLGGFPSAFNRGSPMEPSIETVVPSSHANGCAGFRRATLTPAVGWEHTTFTAYREPSCSVLGVRATALSVRVASPFASHATHRPHVDHTHASRGLVHVNSGSRRR